MDDDLSIGGHQADHMIFAGRETELLQIQGTISDPNTPQVIAFSGIPQIGKTTLLQQTRLQASSDYICVYVPLKELSLQREFVWLHSLSELLQDTVAIAGYTPQPSPTPDTAADLRDSLRDNILPEIYRVIRPHRVLVLLLDDIGRLLQAIDDSTLPEDTFAYLNSLIHPQLTIITTFDLQLETELTRFTPLVSQDRVFRLKNLSQENVEQLLTIVLPSSSDTDAITDSVFQITGGIPVLVHAFVKKITAHSGNVAPSDLQKFALQIYEDNLYHFQMIWRLLDRDERLALTAIASLLHAVPRQVIDLNQIEKWLAEADYTTDSTAISVALRGLEYLDVVTGGHAEVEIRASLMQKWLLENARLDNAETTSTQETSRSSLILAGIVGILLLVLLLLVFSTATDDTPIPPTVTLSTGD